MWIVIAGADKWSSELKLKGELDPGGTGSTGPVTNVVVGGWKGEVEVSQVEAG